MNTASTTKLIAKASPSLKARIAGALYLISGQAFSFSEFSVRGKLVVDGNAAATAQNILPPPRQHKSPQKFTHA